MQISELIGGCVAGTGEAWGELFQVLEAAALTPIEQLLGRFRQDVTEARDVIQELYFYLSDRNHRLLREFDGVDEGDLRDYLRTIAFWYAKNRTRRWVRARRREARMLRGLPRPARKGLTEQDFRNALEELEAMMSASDWAKWKRLQDADCPAPQPGSEGSGPTDPNQNTPVAAACTVRTLRNPLARADRLAITAWTEPGGLLLDFPAWLRRRNPTPHRWFGH